MDPIKQDAINRVALHLKRTDEESGNFPPEYFMDLESYIRDAARILNYQQDVDFNWTQVRNVMLKDV